MTMSKRGEESKKLIQTRTKNYRYLTERQVEILHALLENEGNMNKTAKQLGVSRQYIQKVKMDKKFLETYNRVIERVYQSTLDSATYKLVDLVDNAEKDSDKLKAIEMIYKLNGKMKQQIEKTENKNITVKLIGLDGEEMKDNVIDADYVEEDEDDEIFKIIAYDDSWETETEEEEETEQYDISDI